MPKEKAVLPRLPSGRPSRSRAAKKWRDPSINIDEHHVYFVALPDLTAVKIGIAADVMARFNGLQTGSPVKLYLIGSVPRANAAAAMKLESALLRAATVVGIHMRGEWCALTVGQGRALFESVQWNDHLSRDGVETWPVDELADLIRDATRNARVPARLGLSHEDSEEKRPRLRSHSGWIVDMA